MILDSTGKSQLPVAQKHSLFPRTVFFGIKFSSNNMSIVCKQFPISLIYQQAINMFIPPCKAT